MTPDDARAAAEQLVEFHERFAPLFGKDQAQDHAYDYLKGLMTSPERESIERKDVRLRSWESSPMSEGFLTSRSPY